MYITRLSTSLSGHLKPCTVFFTISRGLQNSGCRYLSTKRVTHFKHLGLSQLTSRALVTPVTYTINRHNHALSKKVEHFIMPDIGEGINEVVIKDWQVKVGDKVKEFDGLCEVESDKATATISSRFAGTILKIHYDSGDLAKVGKPLVDIEVVGEEEVKVVDLTEQHTLTATNADERSSKKRNEPNLAALPSVRQLAKQKGVDLSKITATGKYGQVLKEDLLAYLEASRDNKSQANSVDPPKEQGGLEQRRLNSSAPPLKHDSGPQTIVPFTIIQKAMFKSMTKSLRIPHFNYADELDLTQLIRKAQTRKDRSGERISNFAFIIKMVSLALKSYPQLNGSIDEENQCLIQKNYHNISIAVDSKAGLIVPNIKNVQSLTIEQIHSELLRLRQLADSSKLSPTDLSGGTISLSNIGAIGGIFGVPVIVPPEIVIGAIGRTQVLPRFNSKGEVEARHLAQLVWSADHRVVDGATLSRFTNLLKLYLEEPELALTKLA